METETLPANQAIESEKRPTSRWHIDSAHSSAEFAVRHMMVSTVKGSFKTLSGTVTLDESNPENSGVEAEIDASSIDTGVPDRDNHLRSPDFFDVAKHPKLRFRGVRIETDDGDSGKLHGAVTIHGVTQPLTLEVSYLGEIRDPWGQRRRGYAAEGILSRKDFGMVWNQVLDAGGVLVGDKIKVTLNIETVEQANA